MRIFLWLVLAVTAHAQTIPLSAGDAARMKQLSVDVGQAKTASEIRAAHARLSDFREAIARKYLYPTCVTPRPCPNPGFQFGPGFKSIVPKARK